MQKELVIAVVYLLFGLPPVHAQEVKIPRGFSQATMNKRVLVQDVTIEHMPIGSERTALDDAVFVDEDNKVWLVGKAPTFEVDHRLAKVSMITIRRSRLGYFVDIPFRYKEINGYSVPKHSQWRAGGHATRYYHIPAMSARVIDPIYPEASPLRKLEQKLANPNYAPRFKAPAKIPNPYSFGQETSDADFVTNAIPRIRAGAAPAGNQTFGAGSPGPSPNPPQRSVQER